MSGSPQLLGAFFVHMDIHIDQNLSPLSPVNPSPLRLSKAAIQDFQHAYLAEYGLQISEEEANRLGFNLLRLFKAVYCPMPVKGGPHAIK